MKRIVYVLTALLAFAGALCFAYILLPELAASFDSLSDSYKDIWMWYEMSGYILNACAFSALGVLSLIQLKKSTPRLLLLFCGISFFGSFGLILSLKWWGFLFLAAGLLPAVYEFIKQGKLAKEAPLQQQRNNGMLIAAGVLACLCIVSGIYAMISTALFYQKHGFDVPPAYYSNIAGIMQSVCIVIFCFLKTRRTSVFYRMFLIGPAALGALYFPLSIIFYIIMYSMPGNFYVDPAYFISSAISLALVLLVLIHAFKTRNDSLTPQEYMDIAPQTEIPVS